MPAPPSSVRTTKPRRKTAGLMSKYRPRPPETPATILFVRVRSRRFTLGVWRMCSVMAPRCLVGIAGAIRIHPGPTPNATLAAVAKQTGQKTIVENRRARYDYNLLERVEAGVALTGTEVKSLRDGRATLAQSYAEVRDGEAWLLGAEISVYDQGNRANHDPTRPRKLLLHRREIDSLYGTIREKGLTLVPTRLYFRDGRVKVELAIARGKEQRDKRRDLKDRDARREVERALKSRR